jgi:hypothetical protein
MMNQCGYLGQVSLFGYAQMIMAIPGLHLNGFLKYLVQVGDILLNILESVEVEF